ncbi:hypothetical protein C8Q72DRAFT_868884, partial [Fomitopsis betulina]
MTQGSVSTKIDYSSTRQHGIAVTGTLQFMALPLLRTIRGPEKARPVHSPSHDLEAIIYVLGYSVLRRLVSTSGCPDILEEAFRACFGRKSVEAIIAQRAAAPATILQLCFIEDPMSDVVCDLFEQLLAILQDLRKREDAMSLRATHSRRPPERRMARPDDGPVHVEFLTHNKLLKPQPDLIVRFDPNQ